MSPVSGAATLAGAATVALLALGLVSPSAQAAGETNAQAAGETKQSNAARQAAAPEDATGAIADHKAVFRVAAKDAFSQRGTAVLDKDGGAHVRYNRTYAGLPVLGGDVVVHLKPSGSYDGGSLTLTRPLTLGTSSKVSEADAIRTAGSGFTGTEQSVTARRVVDALDSTPKLAYEVTINGVRKDQTPAELHVVVDAVTGTVLRSADEVKTGTGNSKYSGTVTIGTSGSAGSFQLSDPTRGNNRATDLNGLTFGDGRLFTDADNVWGNPATSDRATAGVDAHYGAQVTFDFYKNVLGRNGIFNNGTGIRSRVHYGKAYVNAFWDGTQMTYGDGAGNAKPLTSIDIAGHEMSHGVTENTANLNYSGESGGLNEATSDIFGTSVEFFAGNANDVGDYLIGEKVDINGDGTPLRYQDMPSRDGRSPDCWSSGVGNLDVHHSSGPANHVFYLLSEGSGAKTINGVAYNSPTCNGSTVTGIGRDNAAKIWYRALSVYMTSSTNYAGARTAAVNAAKDLYGATSAQCAGVENAFSGISVAGTTCGGTTPPTGGNKIANPGFESGAASWTQTTGVIINDATKVHGGAWFGWLDGYGTTHTDTLSQTVTIPAASGASLSLWLKVTSAETTTTSAFDTLKVQVLSGTTTTLVATYSNLHKSASYAQQTLNLSSFVGKTVTIRLVGVEDSALATNFFVDDLSLTTA
jgi:Zn-dependent metalloprotease